MKIPECDYRASQKYQREKTRSIGMQLNLKYDADILAWLDSQPNKQGYLKDLIRADMAKQGYAIPEDQ